jgi:predicted ATPase
VLADVWAHLGHSEDALQALAEAHTLVEQHGERWWEAEVHRLRGVLLLQQTLASQEEAEACLQQALTVARRQQAKSLELRAAMSLARLWQQQGKRTEARELLAPIYGWFTEGFDTADLQEAKALLESWTLSYLASSAAMSPTGSSTVMSSWRCLYKLLCAVRLPSTLACDLT